MMTTVIRLIILYCMVIAAVRLMGKKIVPPVPLANALTVLSQSFGFLVSRASLKSQSVDSAIRISCKLSNGTPPFAA